MADTITKQLPTGQAVVFYLLWMTPTFVVIPGLVVASVLGKTRRMKPLTISLIVALFVAGIFHIMLLFLSPKVFVGRLDYTQSFWDSPEEHACVIQQSTLAGIEHLIMFCLIGVLRDVHNDLRASISQQAETKLTSKRTPGRTWVTLMLLAWPWVGILIIAVIGGLTYGYTFGEYYFVDRDSFGGDGGLPYCAHAGGEGAGAIWIVQSVNPPLYIAAIVMMVLVFRKYARARAQGLLTVAEDSWLRWFCVTVSVFIVVMILRTIAMSIPGSLGSAPTLLFAIFVPALVIRLGWAKRCGKTV